MSLEAIELESDESFVTLADLPLSEAISWNGRNIRLSSIGKERTRELFFQALYDQKQIGIITFSAEVEDNEKEGIDLNAEKPYSNQEILTDIAEGLGHSATAGIAASTGLPGMPVAIVEVYEGSKCFIDAAKKYNENVKFEKDSQNGTENDDYDRSHDYDSWDREF